MKMPGFSAEKSLYTTEERYFIIGSYATSKIQVEPAMPTCANCEWACDQCFECRDSGKKHCPTCGVCNYCAPRSCSGGVSVGGGLMCCEFLKVVEVSDPGNNCNWCGASYCDKRNQDCKTIY